MIMGWLASIIVISLCTTVCYGFHYGIIYGEDMEGSGGHGYYCMVYNPMFHSVPKLAQDAKKFPLVDLTPNVLCEEQDIPSSDLTDKAVAISRGNCTFTEKARNVQSAHGKVALIVSKSELSEPHANQTSDYQEINVTVALIGSNSFQQLTSLGNHVHVQLYAPEVPRMDYNLILIWVMAVGTVVLGSFWSGLVKHRQRLRRVRLTQKAADTLPSAEMPEPDEEQETFDVSPKFIIFFVVLMCGMLVALYFLYDYLVYFIIVVFAIASSSALYSCLKLVLIRIPCIGHCRLPPNKIPILSSQPEVSRIILAFLCLGVGVWWAVERKADYSWILQDILGMVFCIHMLKTVRLSSLKACTVLLVLLFFYDVFFVFITPLLTKSGQSVMVDVATGGDSSTGEMLPMVLRVPRFDTSVLSVCSLPYSLLGFGDILVPGLLVSFCHGFDLKVSSGRIYFISNVIAYGVGLVLTFIALAIMDSGQPALLYLVPCTLLTTYVVALKRRELRHMWRGELKTKTTGDKNNANNVSSGTAPDQNDAATSCQDAVPNSTTTSAAPATTLGLPSCVDQPAENSSFSSDNEQQHLIHRSLFPKSS